MEDMKIALFDMDGTICDYVGSMKKVLDKLRAVNEPEVDPFSLDDDPQYDYLWERMDLIKADENWWANLPRMPLGFEIMELTKEMGFYIEVLTQAPKNHPAALAGKLKWILEHLDENTDFTMTRNKSRHYGNVLVDDFPDYILGWLKYRKNGLVIMPANEYNKDFRHDQVIRYNGSNLDEVRQALLKVLEAQ